MPLPRSGVGLEATIERVASEVLPRSLSHSHPRSFPFIDGSGLEAGVAAAVLAAALDANLGGGAGAASEVEDVAWRWLAELIGFPAGGRALHERRHARQPDRAWPAPAPGRCRTPASTASRPARPRVYASEQAHNSIARACDVLGLGRRALRPIRCDDAFRVRPDELARAIETDVAAGVTPVAVVGVAGTTSTGAVDPLDALADICAEHGVWLHVDGAYGAPAAAAPTSAALLPRASSASTRSRSTRTSGSTCRRPSAASSLRDPGALGDAFADEAAYLENVGDGPVRRARLAGLAGHRGDAPVPRPRALDGVPRLRRRRARRGRSRTTCGSRGCSPMRCARRPISSCSTSRSSRSSSTATTRPGSTTRRRSTRTTARCSTRCSATGACSRRARRSAARSRCGPA